MTSHFRTQSMLLERSRADHTVNYFPIMPLLTHAYYIFGRDIWVTLIQAHVKRPIRSYCGDFRVGQFASVSKRVPVQSLWFEHWFYSHVNFASLTCGDKANFHIKGFGTGTLAILYSSQFHNHAQSLIVKTTWHTNGWPRPQQRLLVVSSGLPFTFSYCAWLWNYICGKFLEFGNIVSLVKKDFSKTALAFCISPAEFFKQLPYHYFNSLLWGLSAVSRRTHQVKRDVRCRLFTDRPLIDLTILVIVAEGIFLATATVNYLALNPEVFSPLADELGSRLVLPLRLDWKNPKIFWVFLSATGAR